MCEEKEQKTLETYQQLATTLKNMSKKIDMINTVHTLIEENDLFPVGDPNFSFKTVRKSLSQDDAVKNSSAHGKQRLRCKDCCAFSGTLTERLSFSDTS